MPNFISDFLEYNSGTECHKSYLRWAAVSALASTCCIRYRVLNGSYYIYPLMYILNVGPQGNKKTYAMSMARDLIEEAFPDHPVGADTTTRDDLIRFLASDLTERAMTDAEGDSVVFHPVSLFISEFKDFVAYNPSAMINWIVNIYDYSNRIYTCSTIKRGLEQLVRPNINILACENTEWFMRRLQEGVVTGGFSRRFIVVFEQGKSGNPVPRIQMPPDHIQIRARMVAHLRGLRSTAREYKWVGRSQQKFDEWYIKNYNTAYDDGSIAGFMSSKDQQIIKLVMLLDLAESEPKYCITEDLLDEALTWYEGIQPGLIKLYTSGGRNELAAIQNTLLEVIRQRGGIITEKELVKIANKDMNEQDFRQSIQYFLRTEAIGQKTFRWPTPEAIPRCWYFLPEAIDEKLLAAIKKGIQ